MIDSITTGATAGASKVKQRFSDILGRAQDALRSPSDVQEVGIGGFRLFARVTDSVTYAQGVPVHVVEDGSFITDHLIRTPVVVQIQGSVSDIFQGPAVEDVISKATAQIGTVSGFLPARTQTQIQAITDQALAVRDTVDRIGQLVDAGRNALDMFGDKSGSTSLREQFLDAMEQVYYGCQLIQIETAYRVHQNMALVSLMIGRDNLAESLTFTLTAQEVRIAETEWVDVEQYFQAPAPAVRSQTERTKDVGATDTKNAPAENEAALRALTGDRARQLGEFLSGGG